MLPSIIINKLKKLVRAKNLKTEYQRFGAFKLGPKTFIASDFKQNVKHT